jgi:hypothetical protein
MHIAALLTHVHSPDPLLLCRLPALFLLFALIAVNVMSSSAVTLNPTDDGLSVPGIFFSKLDLLSETRKSIARPPRSEDKIPCYQENGDDCSDYDSSYDPCNKFTCGPPHTHRDHYATTYRALS